MDTQATSRYGGGGRGQDYSGSERPRYRCALYEEDVESGHIRMALSSDSTCINHLRSPTDGYETLSLRPKFPPAWPAHLRYSAVSGKEENVLRSVAVLVGLTGLVIVSLQVSFGKTFKNKVNKLIC